MGNRSSFLKGDPRLLGNTSGSSCGPARKVAWERWRAERGRKLAAEMKGMYAELPRRYGITVDDYDRMLRQQNGLCAICGQPPKARKRLGVDHVHDETKHVRGLLCDRCNLTVGLVERIGARKIIEYMVDHVAKR